MHRKWLIVLIGLTLLLIGAGGVYQAFFQSQSEQQEEGILPGTVIDLGDFNVTIFRGQRTYRHVRLTISVEAYDPIAKLEIERRKQELRDVFIREINSYLNIQYDENSDPQIREIKKQKNINDLSNLKKRLRLVARKYFKERMVKDIFVTHYVERKRR